MISRELNLKLGEILVERGYLTRDQLQSALREQKTQGTDQKRIGSYLLDLGHINEDHVAQALGIQFNLPVMRLEGIRVKPEVLDLIPEAMAKRFNVMPLFRVDEELTLAISDPTDISLFDIVRSKTGCKVSPVIAAYGEIGRMIERYYSKRIEANVKDVTRESEMTEISRYEIEELKRAGVDLPIVKIVDRILLEAVEDGASDIHVEPRESLLTVRFRVDGILHEFQSYPVRNHPGIVSRIKILASLDISERQRPQDGRIQVKVENREIDIRVSTLPTQHGEKVVMRLLNREAIRVRIEDLGFSESNLAAFREMISQPYGIVLVTGPTGSGKTTTLYAALNEINSPERNIVTVEDPIEYQLPIINQVQLNVKKDVTFANALRAILRQDPDVIMIGEIRDPETASIAAESALTGHLVFSTLHTNDAPSSITRLIDMGIAPFLLAPSLLGIISQRLIRKVCTVCREEYAPSAGELQSLGLAREIDTVTFFRGTGCTACKETGYRGRSAIHEIMVVDERMREMIADRASVVQIREEAFRRGYRDMRFDGLRKVFSGVTTAEEVLRVTKSNR